MTDSEQERLEREIGEVRAREAKYRSELAARAARRSRLRVYTASLQQLLRTQPPQLRSLSKTLIDVARISSEALEVPRTSIWLLDQERDRLTCLVRLEAGAEQPVSGLSFVCKDCQTYLGAFEAGRPVACADALTDPRTRELESYLRAGQVGALLDIPIVIPGKLLGVVCHEHVGRSREWHDEEIDFATNVGSLVALALETERRLLAEYTAEGTEAKYRHLVESLPVAVYSFEVPSGKLEYVSPRVERLSGLRPEELIGTDAQQWVEHIVPEDRAPVLRRFEVGAGPGFPKEIAYRIVKADGTLRWVRDTCTVVRDPIGRAVALQGVLADVTERVAAEQSRDEFERRYRALLENVDLLAVVLDAQGRIAFVNDCFCRLTGFGPEQLLGRDWFETLLAAEDRRRERARFSDALRGSGESRFENQIRTAGGEARSIVWASTVLRRSDGGVEGTSSIGFDLTDRARLELQVLEQTKLESLGRLAAGVAHDFNNLLLVMSFEQELLREEGLTERARTAHEHLSAAITQATELTRSLLVYGRKQPQKREPIALDALIADTLPLASAVAGKNARVTCSLHAPAATVLIDRAQVRQLVLNLIGNSADALEGRESEIRVSTHIEFVDDGVARRSGAQQGGEFVVLSVSDDGKGMDAKTVGQVFDPFFTTKEDGKGTGLGLATCQTIMRRALGFITVDSRVGEGTTFRLFFPMTQAVSGDVAPISMRSGLFGVRSGRPRVLVVEDMPELQRALVSRLRQRGYHVVAVEGVSAALRVLATEPVDLLITDGSLGDGSGPVLARSARAAYPRLQVMLISGSIDGDWHEDFDAVLPKPFTEQELNERVEALLGQRVTDAGQESTSEG